MARIQPKPPPRRTVTWISPKLPAACKIIRFTETPAKLVGLVYNQPDAESAIKAAIEEYHPPNERGRLIAQRRD